MNAIKSIRVNIFGMTQVEFASVSRVTQPTVHRWEKDARAHPSLENLVAAARSVEVTTTAAASLDSAGP